MTRTSVSLALAIALVAVADVGAWWVKVSSGNGAAAARAMPAGNAPSASALLTSVTVTWAASAFSGGPNVAGYVVKRYDATNTPQSVGAACSGIVSALACTETGVPAGAWKYTVTPAQGLWRGTESGMSAPVVVL